MTFYQHFLLTESSQASADVKEYRKSLLKKNNVNAFCNIFTKELNILQSFLREFSKTHLH